MDQETRALLADATAHLKTLLAFAEAVASTMIDGDIVNGELGLDDPMNIGRR